MIRVADYPVAISKPTVGSGGRTGTWRIFKPILHRDRCIGCLLCWLFCPEGAVERREEGILINYEYCKGCGICSNECPRGAIEMVYEMGE